MEEVTLNSRFVGKQEVIGAATRQEMLSVGDKSPSLTMSAVSSTLSAHDYMHSL
jgi:hypothetical protein